MNMINIVVACDDKGGIGRNGALPWRKSSEDLQRFKRLTKGKSVVMGSGTWHSTDMPNPLPKRHNVVVTTKPESCPSADEYMPYQDMNVCESIECLAQTNEVFVIGGAQLLRQTIGIADRVYLTRFCGVYDCDRFISLSRIHNNFILSVLEYGDDATYETWIRQE